MSDAPFEYRDALPAAPGKGRGAGLNPGNRFESVRLHILGEHLDTQRRAGDDDDLIPSPRTQVLPDKTQRIINKVQSEIVPFEWTLNPYRGCEHGCIYCYARPYHEYLGMSSGIDFETKIMAKRDAAKLLREELSAPGWEADTLVMSSITDCWQPIEAELKISRACLEVMLECRQPVSVLTKNRLLLRDLDLLKELAGRGLLAVSVTITTLDNHLASISEPRASAPRHRIELIRQLASAGIPVNVMVAPVIPGLNDREIPTLLKAVADAGARHANYILIRLPWQLKELYEDWLRRHFPDRADHVLSLLRQSYDGKLYDSAPALRGRGDGEISARIYDLFKMFTQRLGLDRKMPSLDHDAFVRPTTDGQMSLFG